VRQESLADIGRTGRGPDVPGPRRAVRPEQVQLLRDDAVGVFWGEVGAHDAVVVVDGDVPDHPPDPPVSRSSAPAARPSATRSSSPFSSIARAESILYSE
jgi:hypothetical protein